MGTPTRQVRERELILATRKLFDERGMQDAPIEEIAREVGIARGLIYRQFSSKEELFFLTVTDYLDELDGLLGEAITGEDDAECALERLAETYADFCARYPAFLDCSLSLMRRRARDLQEIVSPSVYLRLGQGMARCLAHLSGVLRSERFSVEDPDLTANLLWTQMLGAMHLARIGIGMRQAAPGVPEPFRLEREALLRACVASAMATVGARR